jgi:aspartate--ammonia ligase
MSKFILKTDYKSQLDIKQTEIAIKELKDFFERALAKSLNLIRVSAPLFVFPETGLNDDLNGVERPVSFGVLEQNDKNCQIVHSLAKWKRNALKKYGFEVGSGLYTDMNAIRRDEETDNIHSIYVDQWDWERVISREDRKIDFLKEIVRKIYGALKETEEFINGKYSYLSKKMPEDIFFITAEELLKMYPNLDAKERENALLKEKKSAFIIGIGSVLSNGLKHDGRAPDYDDWSLNGDIMLYNPILESAFEISSMGIRVDEKSLAEQLKIAGAEDRKAFKFHSDLLQGNLPLTIGGGIGQSRLCMYYLEKLHIGEVHSSVWTDETIDICNKNEINLL